MIIARPKRRPRARNTKATILSGLTKNTPTVRHNNEITRQMIAIAACLSDFLSGIAVGREDLLIIRSYTFRLDKGTRRLLLLLTAFLLLSMTILYDNLICTFISFRYARGSKPEYMRWENPNILYELLLQGPLLVIRKDRFSCFTGFCSELR
jgi:hypothetical protein